MVSMELWDVRVHLFPKRYRDKNRVVFRSVKHLKSLLFDSARIKMGLRFLGFSCSESSSLGFGHLKKK